MMDEVNPLAPFAVPPPILVVPGVHPHYAAVEAGRISRHPQISKSCKMFRVDHLPLRGVCGCEILRVIFPPILFRSLV